MNAASCVEIGRLKTTQPGSVRVAGDENTVVFFCPLGKFFFRVVLTVIVLGGAGGIQDAEVFKRFPDVANQKAGETPQVAVEKVGLVAVDEIKVALAGQIV